MKTLRYLFMAVIATTFTACMNGDWDKEVNNNVPYGDNSIQETNLMTIKQLKDLYKSEIETRYSYKLVNQPTQIKGVVTGNDIEGNIYSELSIQDETGAIIIAVSQGGINGYLPIGQEIIVELNGLYVGNYGLQAEIGTPYTNASGSTYVSRMNPILWNQHFRVTGNRLSEEEVMKKYCTTFADGSTKTTWDLYEDCGKLGTLKNVTFKEAGKATFANAGGGPGSVSQYFNEQAQTVMIYNSNYADFAADTLPTGKQNVTGILKRYNNSWEIILRKRSDVQPAQ